VSRHSATKRLHEYGVSTALFYWGSTKGMEAKESNKMSDS